MKEIVVDACYECPFVDRTYEYEWSEYTCEFGPEPKKAPDGKGVIPEVIKSGTEDPPEWCPLRKEAYVVKLP